ncbi:hypothetical protein LTR94_025308, partial [Friedmanniomyces endolithicus]
MSDYLKAHPLRGAFLANALEEAARLIVDQGDALLSANGLDVPSRAVSTLLFIGDCKQTTTADIAKALNHPHQLVAQRIDLLSRAGLLERPQTTTDRRRKPISLTRLGVQKVEHLRLLLTCVDRAFDALSEELGLDLATFPSKLTNALMSRPLAERGALQAER